MIDLLTIVNSEKIAEQIRTDILSGRLPEGAPLREESLAKRFNASRGNVREALQVLTHSGVVVSKRHHGARVAPAVPDEIAELVVPIRRQVEVFALRSYFADLQDSDFQRWDEILTNMRAACETRDYHGLVELDVAFHEAIVKRSGLPDLVAIWTTLVSRLRRNFLRGHRRYDDLMHLYWEHVAIAAAFRAGNVDAASLVLEQNIGGAPRASDR